MISLSFSSNIYFVFYYGFISIKLTITTLVNSVKASSKFQ